MAANTNVVVVTGRLTRDPEVKQLAASKSVASSELAVNGFGEKVSVP
jgi:single-stranded DNA-binding protein